LDQGKTAFVLSGGGSLGAIQVGMLKALYERDIRPDIVFGTSVGAINGAYVASHPPEPKAAEGLAEIWRGLRRSSVFPIHPVAGLIGFLGLRSNFIPPRNLRRLVDRHISFERLEDATIPFHVIATDVYSGKEVRLSEGPAVDAVMASAAIPGVFPPVKWKNTELIDGGVSNNTPITDAIELGADEVYVLPTGTGCDLQEVPRGALEMILHAITLLVHRRLLIEIELLKDRTRLIVLPPPCPLRVHPGDFGEADELIGRSYEDAVVYLNGVEKGELGVPLEMSMHGH
jgi:NTE family protein